MKTTFQAVGLFLTVAVGCGIATAGDSIAEKLAAIKKEHEVAQATFQAAAKKAKTPEENKKAGELFKAMDKRQLELFPEAVALAKKAPKSDDAMDALEWVLSSPRSYLQPAGIDAMVWLQRIMPPIRKWVKSSPRWRISFRRNKGPPRHSTPSKCPGFVTASANSSLILHVNCEA